LIWPVPQSYSCFAPQSGEIGGFREDRGDRCHCGVDIYAPPGARVLAVANGNVVESGLFTSPEQIEYWNETFYLILQHNDLFIRYAELEDRVVSEGKIVTAGQLLGHVGQVLVPQRISERAPDYIRRLLKLNHLSMLHLEVYTGEPKKLEGYRGGNLLSSDKPSNFVDPAQFLQFADG